MSDFAVTWVFSESLVTRCTEERSELLPIALWLVLDRIVPDCPEVEEESRVDEDEVEPEPEPVERVLDPVDPLELPDPVAELPEL